MHIFLVGMAGGGKTTLGKRLAERLQRPFIDTDQQIIKQLKMSSSEIYRKYGEEFYRNQETGILIALIGKTSCVVSTGCDLPTIKENVQLMKNHGIIVHINRPIDQILSDIKLSKRPMLAGASREEVIATYNNRIGYYKSCADLTLDNSSSSAAGAAALYNLVQPYI
jgi:shikimate kinase